VLVSHPGAHQERAEPLTERTVIDYLMRKQELEKRGQNLKASLESH